MLFVEPAEVEPKTADARRRTTISTSCAPISPRSWRGAARSATKRAPTRTPNGARKAGARAREQLAHLFDDGEFLEYGEFALAAQRRRRDAAELERMSPADGLIAGIGHVNGDRFDDERSRCIAMAYDYTVFAGTQGYVNHLKTDRMLGLAQAAPAAAGDVRRRRRRTPGRHRRHVGIGPRGADVRELRAA